MSREGSCNRLDEYYRLRSKGGAPILQIPMDERRSTSRATSVSSGLSDVDRTIFFKVRKGIDGHHQQLQGINSRLVFAIAAAVIGSSFQHGYNTGVVNAPQKLIEEWIADALHNRSASSDAVVVDQEQVTMIFSVFVAIFCVGGMLGGCATGVIADRFGRRGGLLLNLVLVAVSGALLGSAKAAASYEMLIAGRFLIGVNSGLNAGLAPMYIAEISPVHLRGATGTVYQLVITASIVLSQFLGTESILGTDTEWPILLAVTVIPAGFQLLTLPFCPESPKYLLVTKGDEQEARRALSWLRGTSDVMDEMDDMKSEYDSLKISPRITMKELFVNPVLRMPMIIAIAIMMAQQFSGINAVMFYSTKIFKMAGMTNENAQYATLAMGLVNVAMTIVSLFLVEKAGRKTLLLFGFQGMFFVSVLFVICLAFAEKSEAISHISIALVLIFVVMFAVGPGSIPWFLVTELFSQSARPVATSIAVAVNWAANFIVGLGFLPLQEVLKGNVFIIFAILLGLFSIFIKLRVPETKNKSIDEISAMFRQRSYK